MIRTVTVFFVILLSNFYSVAQSDAISRILNVEPKKVQELHPKPDANTLIIPSSFSQEAIRATALKPKGEIHTVYYIYTAYRQSTSFNQQKLNRERIKRLFDAMPELSDNNYLTWRIIEQTGCASAEMGKSYFHGFVLEYRAELSAKDRSQEIANLETYLKDPSKGYLLENDPGTSNIEKQLFSAELEHSRSEGVIQKTQPANFPDGNLALYEYFKKNIPADAEIAKNRDDIWVPFSFEVNEKGEISDVKFAEAKPYIQRTIKETLAAMPNWTPASEDGRPITSRVNLNVRISYSPIVRGMYKRDGRKPKFTQQEKAASTMRSVSSDNKSEERIKSAESSAIYQSMEDVIPKEKVAIVMDVTTSMSAHLASMNWWVANSADSLNIVHYTFFNDGDNIEDRKKKPGKTGGIYHGTKLRELPATLLGAMRNGNGGDVTENDYEAVLSAQNQATNADAILLIVDNFSDVRDEKLLSQITMKTHVLVAGEVNTVRECYLNIAKATGGDIFVNGKRINLQNVQKGGRIVIAESTYILEGESFKLI